MVESNVVDLARSLATCCLVSDLKVSADWNACFKILVLSIPVITPEVGRLME
jgi:hypothetical protein